MKFGFIIGWVPGVGLVPESGFGCAAEGWIKKKKILRWVTEGFWELSLDWRWMGLALTYLANLWASLALGAVLVVLDGAIWYNL
jgi:hypothetical protein